jgi:hypothetical protein
MSGNEKPTQKTRKGLIIPIPTGKDFEAILKETAKDKKPEPEKPSATGSLREH